MKFLFLYDGKQIGSAYSELSVLYEYIYNILFGLEPSGIYNALPGCKRVMYHNLARPCGYVGI